MLPKYESTTVTNKILEPYKINKNPPEKLQFVLGGYVVRRTTDGAMCGTSTGDAYYLFLNKEAAEATKRAVDSDGNWEIMYLGCLWLDKNPLENV